MVAYLLERVCQKKKDGLETAISQVSSLTSMLEELKKKRRDVRRLRFERSCDGIRW
jgi:hypothetical protein